jgi:ankyrin repeat protein
MSIEPKNNSFQPKQMCFDPSLHTAVLKKNHAECYRLIEARADVNARDSWGWTPLHTAVHGRWSKGSHLLMDSGADVNATGAHDAASLLSLATLRSKSLAAVRTLMGQGASVEQCNHGWSPLQLAIQDGNLEMVRFLIERGANVEPQDRPALSSLLPIAIKNGHFETIRCLIENGAILRDGEKRALGNFLLTVIRRGSLEMFHFLLEHGAYPSIAGLEIAIKAGQSEMIRSLISVGCVKNDFLDLKQLLSRAQYIGHPEIVRTLVEHGLDVARVLKVAIQIGCVAMVRCLVDSGVNKTILDTALEIAVKEDRLTIARDLIDAGAEANEQTRKNIEERFVPSEVGAWKVDYFLLRRPRVCALEVFQGECFQSLADKTPMGFNKPIALLNIAAYERMGPQYGAIAKCMDSSFTPLYRKMAKHFTLTRVLIDDPKQLISVIEKVKAAFPTLPLLYWALNGHGNTGAIGLGEKLLFTLSDTKIMRKISDRIDSGGVIALWGCNNADGDCNIVKVFSEQAPRQIVLGAPNPVSEIIPIIVYSTACKIPSLLTAFADWDEPDIPIRLRAYKQGKEIMDGVSPRSWWSRL